jgi:ribose 1,5-bisphosphokinase
VQDLRERYANVLVIEVTASPEILAARLAGRGRAADGDVSERVRRSVGAPIPDRTISNAGALEPACESFLGALAADLAQAQPRGT